MKLYFANEWLGCLQLMISHLMVFRWYGSLSQLMITFGVLLLKELTGLIAVDDSSLFPLLIEKQNILGSVDSVI